MKYWMIDSLSKEIMGEYDAQSKWNIPRNAMTEQPLQPKQGFAVVAILDESGKAIDSEYIEDHRGVTIYDESNCTKSEVVSELGPIKEGFTTDKPMTEFDERIEQTWVTNVSHQYSAEYCQVDQARRSAYSQAVSPLLEEAHIKRNLIGTPEAITQAENLEQQVLEARLQIQQDNPWPTPPTL